jgi:predicted phosphodiesterase
MAVVQVGLIADTHGLLRPEAMAALRGSDHIVHAGDIGGPEILEALAEIAPVAVGRLMVSGSRVAAQLLNLRVGPRPCG